jgi:hypothetical protein
MQNELGNNPLAPLRLAQRNTSPSLGRGSGTVATSVTPRQAAGEHDVRTMPNGYRVYTKLMPAPLSILRTDRGLDDKQPVSLVYVSILG